MALLKQSFTTPPHHHQIPMAPATSRKSSPNGNAGGKDVKQRVNMYMNKLSDRDTEAMAAIELEAMARDLPVESMPSFLSAISDTRPSDKTPLRRHCVRLLSLLSRARQPQALAPLLPRMLAAVLRRIRDSDSSVRAACVDAVRDMCRASNCSPSSTSCVVFLRPLSESLLLEQDGNAQMTSALCLAAAIDEVAAAGGAEGDWGAARRHDLVQHLHRLLPRLVKLAKSDRSKAKPALLALLGSVVAAGGVSTPALLGILVPCLVDALASDDWAARKAAAEALTRVATIPQADLLSGFKSSHFSSFQARRFDKVKIVRDSMNQMLEAWKEVPDALEGVDGGHGENAQPPESVSSSGRKENMSDGQPARTRNAEKSTIPLRTRKNRSPVSESSPTDALSTPARRKSLPNTGKRMNQPMSRKLDNKPSDWKIEIAVPQAAPSTIVGKDACRNDSERDGKVGGQCKNQGNSGSKLEARKLTFENSEGRMNKFGVSKPGSRVTPVQEQGMSDHTVQRDEVFTNDKDSDLSLIRRQLVQIENQQSSLLDLVQRFMGNSQSGMNSLETRVHGLEVALDELCHDLTVFGRIPNTDPVVRCCRIPGAEFFSSKFWRRAEGRYSSKFSISASAPIVRVQNSGDKGRVDTLEGGKQVFLREGGFVVNPLAEVSSQSRRSSNVSPKRMLKSNVHNVESQPALDSNGTDDMIRMTTTTDTTTRYLR